ncbi:Gfo/Idh/MocA family oxidoreductase [Dactylosporangium roseum]|uniref:Gfo/Idh/MocA family oxidoreductase n=1 Tax=Dactylosporangium roseum TaxID=47989 RepID=A0ABY5ZCL3_9ACTN|nr:Gfo/Idh/MocA family oxidoreductase [Dactylosporangium roseum]UWZ39316.1 Gfo/Idh/MocA family oxidoreductase [Dactylosporangium roseum]
MGGVPELRCLLIGVGRRALDDYVPALAELAPRVEFVAACDVDRSAEERLNEKLSTVQQIVAPRFFTDRAAAMDETSPNFAIVATPHHTHLDVARDLILRGIPFLKEKPFAISLPQAHELAHLLRQEDSFMRLCVQRRYHPLYAYAKSALAQIGDVRHFEAIYQLNADGYRDGWRAHPNTSGGGAIIDMGYHMIDVLQWFFGPPSLAYATTAPKLIPSASYDVEETVLANLTYRNGTTGTLRLSLCEATKEEKIRIYGAEGHIELTRQYLRRYDRSNNLTEEVDGDGDWATPAEVVLDTLAKLSDRDVVAQEVADGLDIISAIDALYRSIVQQAPVKPTDRETCSACYDPSHRRRDSRADQQYRVLLAEAATRMA